MTVPAAIATIGDRATRRIECQVLSATVHHGRDDASSQPVASTATLELVGPLPPEALIGQRVHLEADLGGTRYTRFDGEVTDLAVGWDSVDITRPRLIAVGDLGRLGRRIVGDAPWSQELDGARVSRILTLAGFPPDPLLSDPGTVQVLARDVDRQPALALAQGTAEDGAGMLWQDREGRIRYADALHRRGAQVALELRSCDIGLGVGWEETLEGLVNEAHVRYGLAPDGGDQPEVAAHDQGSIDARGTFGASLSTGIATAVDAQKRADVIVARQAVPSWLLGGVEVDLYLFDDAMTAELLELEVHDLVSVTGLPQGSPMTSAPLWVEGWRETIEGVDGGASWRIAFATSDYCRTSAPPTWNDLPPSLTWATVDRARTWDRSTCLPPQPSYGRWNDSPSSLRWETVDPAVTWDTWPY
jgi:hypothetical protein